MRLPLSPSRRSFTSLPHITCSTKCLTNLKPHFFFFNAIIRATIEKRSPKQAFQAFKSLLSSSSIQPNHHTLSLLLKACTFSSQLSITSQFHIWIIKLGLQCHISIFSLVFNLYVSRNHLTNALQLLDEISDLHTYDPFYGNLLIMSFSREEDIESAYKVFDRMPKRDKISWNSMISAAACSSRFTEAIGLYGRMMVAGVEPDCFSFSTVLSACARAGALCHGEKIHRQMEEKEESFESNPFLCSALIDMYSKCGRIDLARRIFGSVKRNSISIWNSMITGLAIHGLGSEAIHLFDLLTKEGVFPDKVTFLGVLTACSHCGMVKEARFFFNSMRREFSIIPELEHYGALVDAMARAGQLNDAYDMINNMPIEPDSAIWRALLGACRRQCRWDVAEMAMAKINRCQSGDFVLLSNIYSNTKNWEKAARVWNVMKERGVRKKKGLSCVEVKGRVQQFKAGDRSHRNSKEIYKVLDDLMRRVKAEGYVPVIEVVTKDVSEEEKEENLKCHSEKLAVAYCVMSDGIGRIVDIRVTKNLQTCWDCHEWMKVVSKVLGRVITVRDRIRFHRFENGACSCRDYW